LSGIKTHEIRRTSLVKEREQIILLIEWYDLMIKKHKENKMSQMHIIAFAMGDLILTSFSEC
jgi:hypothetical protein